jgi:CBS domain-containing protein
MFSDQPKSITIRPAPTLSDTDPIGDAVRTVLEADLPALPVVDAKAKLVGIFGEREFITALFPGYVGALSYAGFVPGSLEELIEKRQECRLERVGKHMNTEHVEAPLGFSDVQLAETFLHHRVLIVPVTDHGAVKGVVTRSDFFKAAAQQFLEAR